MRITIRALQFISVSLSLFILLSSSVVLLQQIPSLELTDVKDDLSNSHNDFSESYTPHGAVEVTDNNEFDDEGFTGLGTKENPYVLSGVNITTSGVCISIRYTTAYFVIRDCLLSGGISGEGIKLLYVDNGIIMNNTVTGKYHGIMLDHSTNNILFNNTVFDNYQGGIYIYKYSDNNIVENNTVVGHPWPGVYINQEGKNNHILNNTLIDNDAAGVKTLATTHNHFENNTILGSNHGIDLSGSINMTLINNRISNCDLGFFIGSDNTTALNNTIIDNRIGISVTSKSNNNTFSLNIVAYNNESNVVDNGPGNYWNLTNRGNYWSDYSGVGVYNLQGDAASIDYHPFFYDTRGPEINHVEDIEYVVGSIGHNVTYVANDTHPSSYEILRNGSKIASESWDGNPIIVIVDGLSVGFYNFTILVNDTSGYMNNDTFFVTVLPVVTNTTTTTTTITTTESTTTTTSTTAPGSTVTDTSTTTNTDPTLLDSTTILILGIFGACVIIVIFVLIRRK